MSKIHRKSDFKIATLLSAASLLLIGVTLSFPMQGNYGGVDSAWYISPALFPLAILVALSALSLSLLTYCIFRQGHQESFQLKGWIGNLGHPKTRDRWYVISALVAYVYILIPSVDFYLATVFFTLSLSSHFYLFQSKETQFLSLIVNGALHALAIIGILLARAWLAEPFYWLSTEVYTDEALIKVSDSVMAGVILLHVIFIVCLSKNNSTSTRRTKIHTIFTCFIIPLIFIGVFSYLLFIPMPVEYGSVASLMDYWVYEVFQ